MEGVCPRRVSIERNTLLPVTQQRTAPAIILHLKAQGFESALDRRLPASESIVRKSASLGMLEIAVGDPVDRLESYLPSPWRDEVAKRAAIAMLLQKVIASDRVVFSDRRSDGIGRCQLLERHSRIISHLGLTSTRSTQPAEMPHQNLTNLTFWTDCRILRAYGRILTASELRLPSKERRGSCPIRARRGCGSREASVGSHAVEDYEFVRTPSRGGDSESTSVSAFLDDDDFDVLDLERERDAGLLESGIESWQE